MDDYNRIFNKYTELIEKRIDKALNCSEAVDLNEITTAVKAVYLLATRK
jgi:hypothetical protein|nr:MAG TPA: ADP-ribosylation factor family protein [Caudoviricetes sp.]